MNRTMRRVIALLLMFMILISSNLTGIVFAAQGDGSEGGVDDGSGASYNQGTGEADIETGTSTGDIKNYAKPEDWAMSSYKGTLTPTLYQLKLNGTFYTIGEFYDMDWSEGTTNYKNSKEEIEGFVRAVVDSPDGKRDNLTESGIWGKGFEVHINAMVFARKPNQTTYNLYNIKEDYNQLMYENGARTWISWVVERAAKNLGSKENGWAYYEVPAQNQVKVVKTFVKVTGVDANGKLIYEEIQQPEIFPAERDATGNFSIEPLTLSSQGIGVLNDVITSTKELEP